MIMVIIILIMVLVQIFTINILFQNHFHSCMQARIINTDKNMITAIKHIMIIISMIIIMIMMMIREITCPLMGTQATAILLERGKKLLIMYFTGGPSH